MEEQQEEEGLRRTRTRSSVLQIEEEEELSFDDRHLHPAHVRDLLVRDTDEDSSCVVM